MIRTSMGILADSSFNPSWSSSAPARDGKGSGVPGSGGIDGGLGGAAGSVEGAVSKANFKS